MINVMISQNLSKWVGDERMLGKYSPLYRFLNDSGEAIVTLYFKEIEALLCFKLPVSAYKHRSWWANQSRPRAQRKAWWNANYLVDEVNYEHNYVCFRKKGAIISRMPYKAPYTRNSLPTLATKVNRLTEVMRESDNLFDTKTIDEQFQLIRTISRILGNINYDLKVLSYYYVNTFLQQTYALKTYRAPAMLGKFIDETLPDGRRIIGKLKTTYPYGATYLSTTQIRTLKKDILFLQQQEADAKYFFVIDEHMYGLLLDKYCDLLVGISIVWLPEALSNKSAITAIKE